MEAEQIPLSERHARPLRPVAHWVTEADAAGRPRLVMVWSVPDVDIAASRLGELRV
jgi:hypothetical protein